MKPRSLVLLLLLGGAAACSGGEPLQVVVGHLERGAWPATEVRATAGGRVLASAAIGADGTFVLGVPPGDGISFQLVDTEHDRAAWLARGERTERAYVTICSARAIFDVGEILVDAGFCEPSPSCAAARVTLDACLGEARARCASHAADLARCHYDHAGKCLAARHAYEACVAAAPERGCLEEEEVATSCGGDPGCGAGELDYWAACGTPCGFVLSTVDERCPGCESVPDLVRTEALLPRSLGCPGSP